MNGAESLVSSLSDKGVDVCFANPGTSEMHFVAALDGAVRMRCVLGLFEGVVTGAADGYYRMQRRPAATLLHLGPGLGNGLANLHNAQKARSGIVNVVGDHAIGHARYESPLHSDIEGIARPVSHWVRRSLRATDVARDAADAVDATRFGRSGRIATLILPADTAWTALPASSSSSPAASPSPGARMPIAGVDEPPFVPEAVEAIASQWRDGAASPAATVLLLGGNAVSARAQQVAAAIARRTGCRAMLEFYQARLDVGDGVPPLERIPYSVDAAVKLLAGTRRLVLAGAVEPVGFFAYPGKPSLLAPAGCQVSTLARPESDAEAALEALADALSIPAGDRDRGTDPPPAPALEAGVGEGDWCLPNIARIIAGSLPEGAVVCDESVTSGRQFAPWFRRGARHIAMQGMGGAIGQGLPGSVGVAVGAPDRQVVVLEGDGSGMYTLQSLWTMARESLKVVVVIFANRAYRILQGELQGVGATIRGNNARAMLSLDEPALDWVSLASGQGVPGERATDLTTLSQAMQRGYASQGPYLVEVVLP